LLFTSALSGLYELTRSCSQAPGENPGREILGGCISARRRVDKGLVEAPTEERRSAKEVEGMGLASAILKAALLGPDLGVGDGGLVSWEGEEVLKRT
jgi:hypothetical protein